MCFYFDEPGYYTTISYSCKLYYKRYYKLKIAVGQDQNYRSLFILKILLVLQTILSEHLIVQSRYQRGMSLVLKASPGMIESSVGQSNAEELK